MGIKKNLLGLVLGTSMMIGGGIGNYYSFKVAGYYLDQEKHYRKLLDINEEKIRYSKKILNVDKERSENISKDLLDPEKILEYRENIDKMRTQSSFLVFGMIPSVFTILGGFSVVGYNLFKLKEHYKNKKSSSKTIPNPKPLELEEEIEKTEIKTEKPTIIDPWEQDFEEIENLRGGYDGK